MIKKYINTLKYMYYKTNINMSKYFSYGKFLVNNYKPTKKERQLAIKKFLDYTRTDKVDLKYRYMSEKHSIKFLDKKYSSKKD